MSTRIRIFTGLILGAIIGSIINNAVLAYCDDWPIFPNVGTYIGGGLGAILCGIIVNVRPFVIALVFGGLAGSMIGVLSGYFYADSKMMEMDLKDGTIRAHFTRIGIAYGVPIGGGFGGLLGIIFYLLKHKK